MILAVVSHYHNSTVPELKLQNEFSIKKSAFPTQRVVKVGTAALQYTNFNMWLTLHLEKLKFGFVQNFFSIHVVLGLGVQLSLSFELLKIYI